MKLFEAIDEYGHKIDQALQAIAKNVLNYDMSGDEARTVAAGLSLSNLLNLDSALERDDASTVAAIMGVSSLEEYALGGMAGRAASSMKSSASSRNERNRRADPSSTLSQPKVAGATNVKPTGTSQSTVKPADEPDAQQPEDDEDTEQDEKLANDIAELKKKAGLK